jgi:SAM-dependent methyltransferase
MDYDANKELFYASRSRSQSWLQRLRWRLALNPVLRGAFDRTYGRAYRTYYSSWPIRHRVAPYLDRYRHVSFSRTGTGFSHEAEIAMLAKLGAVRNKDVLLIGVEYGTEVDRLWGPHSPKQIVGIDIGDYDWSDFYRRHPSPKTPLRFLKMDASQLDFAPSTFDLIYSQGVLPHIVDVPSFLDGAARTLRSGGIFYAFCCPLWRTYGGSHVHALGYDHLRLPNVELLRRAKALQDGSAWWLELGLFNKLRFRDLLRLMEDRFEIVRVGIIEAPDGCRVRSQSPDEWQDLRRENDEEDLLIRLVSFTARRR